MLLILTINTNMEYATLYFKYLVLTLINGKPIIKPIRRLEQELCVNASRVKTDLRGGDHGYIGLYL